MTSERGNPTRIFCVEDNALLVLHLEMIIEEAGYVFAGSATRFDDVKRAFAAAPFDLALVDIDLADGRTGGEVARWLKALGCPSLFITGQERLADDYSDASIGVVVKPISEGELRETLRGIVCHPSSPEAG